MSLTEQVQKDMVDAMRKKEELRLSTLRMMKAALKNKQIEKRAALDEKEELQVLSTMIKQRKDSIEQFEKGNRPELARREAEEITIIEGYMPKAVGEEEIVAAVRATIAEMGSPTMKDMGAVMKNVMAKFGGARVDGKIVSEAVKKELAGKVSVQPATVSVQPSAQIGDAWPSSPSDFGHRRLGGCTHAKKIKKRVFVFNILGGGFCKILEMLELKSFVLNILRF